MRSNRIRMLGVVVVMLSPLILRAGEGQIRRSPNAVKDEYIVVLNDDTPLDRVPELAKQLSKAHGGELKRVWGYALKGFFVRMNESQAFGLSHNPHVKYIEENAEMFLSASAPTKIDPFCTPSPCATSDNRLWHLDVLDQKSAIPNNEYRYCSTGSGVYVYVIDTGVVRAHHEFNNDPNRVVAGYDASGDPSWFPAWDPLHGFPSDDMAHPNDLGNIGHGTGVASLIAGKNVGVARDAIIVPVKTSASARAAALALEQNKTYVLDQIVTGSGGAYYKITTPGVTNAPRPGRWPWKDAPCDPVPCPWGEVEYEYMDPQPPSGQTVQMVVDGLDWILRPSQPDPNGNWPSGPGSPYPKTPAVVTLSTYRVVCGAGVTNSTCTTSSLEDAIGSLLKYNNGHGITVIASANNQDSNACETSPGRMSRNNPNNPNDPDQPYKVITAGGTMLRNIPDPVPNPASGGSAVSQSEPAYDSSKPTLLARWRCHAGDSDICAVGNSQGSTPANIYSDPPPTIPNPLTSPISYVNTTLGSNWGRCVTLFAPAKNIQVASLTATNGYRDPRATGGVASGTSWSAPIVAAMAARILQGNPNLDVDGVYNALMSHTTETLDTRELQPAGQTGTPRSVLQLADVVASPLPNTIPKASSGSTAITVSASATTAITSYELFRVNADYDLSLGRFNAAASVSIATSLSSTFQVNPSVETSYFVRVHTNCGSADTNITTVTIQATPPPAPTGFTATTVSGSVSFGWSPVSGADSYRVERKLPGLAWATAIAVSGGAASSASESAPSAPEGVVLYRVRALAGSVVSNPSNNDVAWVGLFDEPVIAQAMAFKGAHIVQMRKAVNGLCLAADLPPQYAPAEVAPTAMNGLFVDDAHFVDLRTRLNAARTNPAVGLPAMSFQTTPVQNGFVLATQIDDLRRGVK